MGSDKLFHKRKKGNIKRKSKLEREYKDSILIVCEGEKTEVNYFKSFPTGSVKILVIGEGKNTISLFEAAVNRWKEFAKKGEIYEIIWVVFDRDSFPQENYNKVFLSLEKEIAKINSDKCARGSNRKIQIKLAYTNEAFELWYLLHYDHHTTGYDRDQYKAMLTKRLDKKYKKNDPNMYSILEKLGKETNGKQGQEFAINNAKKLYKETTPYNNNPSTSVHLLVEDLNKLLKE